ncbi:hypothetical protein M404DRAFT_165615, partial [Pisolithus tinctorius Marx 270]
MPLSALQQRPGKFAKSDVLNQVRKVIRDIVTPSWLGSVPSNFGNVSAGTIKADEWRSLITVYLPLALINLWGTTSAYRAYIASYVGKLKELYPTLDAQPNHHASFHIYDSLLLFGPMQSWWCFPFERLIGVLQRLPTNYQTGELEKTMIQSYLKAGRLRSWLSQPRCPPAIHECKLLLD